MRLQPEGAALTAPAVATADGFPLDSLGPGPDAPFGVYVHVPFCASRCGYCDFNTYTPGELGGRGGTAEWFAALEQELELASAALGRTGAPPVVGTVFVGGGTPSLLGADGLARVLGAIGSRFPLAGSLEATCEANPESTSPEFFEGIRAAGYTRVSLGMQSAAAHVLAVLDRAHTPGRAPQAAEEARAAGFEHVNLDLIYGTPGESEADLKRSLAVVAQSPVDHVSAYALTVHEGTAMGRAVSKGLLSAPDDDVLAERHAMVDETLAAAGYDWYEVSNWAKSADARCRHNLGYWQGGDWWGAGPGAHSHVDGVRWWNVKHPARYAAMASAGEVPVAGFEALTAEERHTEDVMLRLRLREGLARSVLRGPELGRAEQLVAEGLLLDRAGRIVLAPSSRMLADGLAVRLLSA
ncbi:MAG: radical SAM family heme chaperone HemW [Segniliparus sp.]|uniref:radical SAM family heme chaperone HemW n=1 Tax=Segniliparus sp. TaxID=2804064 RepID=UPI003F414CBE